MKNFFLFVLLLLVQQISFANPTRSFTMPRIVFADDISCNLPPPSALNVNAIGPDWVTVSWPSVLGASQYRLVAFDGSVGDALGAPVLVSGGATSATITTEGNSGSAYVRIWSVCENGDYNTASFTQSETFDVIVVDLIVNGFNFPSNFILSSPVGVGYGNGQEMAWDGTETFFMVSYPFKGDFINRKFSVFVENLGGEPNQVKVNMGDVGNDNEYIVFDFKDYNSSDQAINFAVKFRANLDIKVAESTLLAGYTAGHPNANNSTPGKLYKEAGGNANCVIKKATPLGMEAPPFITGYETAERAVNPSAEAAQTTIQPNPFNDHLTVKLPDLTGKIGATVHLYDLLGSVNRTYLPNADQTELTLNTANLIPGVYFLRIEAGDILKTIKVVKTQ